MKERQRWNDFTDKMPPHEHSRLVMSLFAGLREARLASQTALDNGAVQDVREHVERSILSLMEALERLKGAG